MTSARPTRLTASVKTEKILQHTRNSVERINAKLIKIRIVHIMAEMVDAQNNGASGDPYDKPLLKFNETKIIYKLAIQNETECNNKQKSENVARMNSYDNASKKQNTKNAVIAI